MAYESLGGLGDSAQAEQLLSQSRSVLDQADQQRSTTRYAEALRLAQQALAADPSRSARYALAQIPPLARMGRCSEASGVLAQYGAQGSGDPSLSLYRSLVSGCGGSSTVTPTVLSIPLGSQTIQVTTAGLVVASVVGLGGLGLLIAFIAKKSKKPESTKKKPKKNPDREKYLCGEFLKGKILCVQMRPDAAHPGASKKKATDMLFAEAVRRGDPTGMPDLIFKSDRDRTGESSEFAPFDWWGGR